MYHEYRSQSGLAVTVLDVSLKVIDHGKALLCLYPIDAVIPFAKENLTCSELAEEFLKLCFRLTPVRTRFDRMFSPDFRA